MSRVVIDTSVLIADIDGELGFADLPGEGTISIVTLCELHHGVLAASDAKRPIRLRALEAAQQKFDPLPVDRRVVPRFGELMAGARRKSKARPDKADALIAATALAYGLPVLTRDKGFKVFDGVDVVFV